MKNIYPLLRNFFLVLFTISTFNVYADEAKSSSEESTMTTLICPDDVWLNCNDEIWYLDQYGTAQYHDYYGWHDAGTPVTNYNLGMCNTGTITRTWSIEDQYWNWQSCTQTIYVSGGSNGFNEYDIDWPEDIILTGCNPNTHPDYLPYGQDKPRWNYEECSMIGVSYTDHLYTINSSCTAILREWKVLDWCQEGYDYYGNQTGLWTYTQEIKIMNSEIPYVQCPDDISVNSYNCWDAVVTVPSLYVPPSSCGGDYTITNNSPYAYSNGANISGVYPIGYTNVKYTIKYGCGQTKTCNVKVHVTNNQGPTPYCYGSLTLVLMGSDTDGDGVNDEGMVELWAKDLDKGSFVNCGSNNYLRFSFSPNVYDDVKVFTCDEVGVNYVDMWVTDSAGNQSFCTAKVTIQNNAANIVDCYPDDDGDDDDDNPWDGGDDDNGGHGSDTTQLYDISGAVNTQSNSPVSGVKIDLANGISDTVFNITYLDTTEVITLDSFVNGSGAVIYTLDIDTVYTTIIDTIVSELSLTDYSNQWGNYLFDSVGVHGELYSITASLDSFFDSSTLPNEINSADLQFLMDYLLGDKDFRENSNFLAADVDGDGDLDFNDLKILYNYVVGAIDEFPTEEWIVVSNDVLALSDDILNEEDLNVTIRTVQGAHITNAHFTVIQVGNILSGNSSGLVAAHNDEGAIQEVIAKAETMTELKTELRNLAVLNQVLAYPNPFTKNFSIEYSTLNAGDNATMELYDINGKIVQTKNVTNTDGKNIIEVDMSEQRSGTYMYRLIDGDKVTSGKILKI